MRRFDRQAIALVVCGALCGSTTSFAQGPQDTTETTDPLRVKATVVVTATRTDADVDKTPLSASVVTAQQLEARPVQALDQQLTLTEGVYVQRFQGFSSVDATVSVRGFTGSSRTLVLVDGHPVNDAYSNGVNWTGLPVEQVDSIEVARGPFSSLYGGNALGGVINIRTRPVTSRQFDFTGEYGSFDTRHVTTRFGDRYMNRLGLSAGFEGFATDGYNSRHFTATPVAPSASGTFVTGVTPTFTTAGARVARIGEGGTNALERRAGRVKGEYSIDAASIVSFQYLYAEYTYHFIGYNTFLRDAAGNPVNNGAVVYDDGGTRRGLNITPNNFLQGPGEQRSHFYAGTYQRAFSNNASLLRLDASLYDIPTYQFRSTGAGSLPASGPGTMTDGSRRTSHANAQFNHSVGQHALVFGAETRQEHAENMQFPVSDWTNKDTRGNQTYLSSGSSINQSAYLQDQFTLGNNVTLVFGGRYDYWKGYDGLSDSFNAVAPRTNYPSRSHSQFSGKAAIGYTAPGDWNLRASLGNSFRNPNVFDLYATSTSGTTITASNPALLPEQVKSWEAGVRKRVGAATSVDLVYYENHVKDLIYRQTDLATRPDGTYRINVNAGGGRTRGLELAASQTLMAGVQLKATYTRTNAVITSNPGNLASVGKLVTNVPDHMGALQLLAVHGRWSGALAGRYMGRLFSTDTNTDVVKNVPGSYSPYFVGDGSISYRINASVQPYVSAENLFNRQYYVFYKSPGRTIFGGVRIHL
jgi:iron complex outermembrane receptor protein